MRAIAKKEEKVKKENNQSPGNYLVYVSGSLEGQRALEWTRENGWTRWEKVSVLWCEDCFDFDSQARRDLLRHFHLEEWQEEFPWERIFSMSPAQLEMARRSKEQQHRLPRADIFRDGDTGRVPASCFS